MPKLYKKKTIPRVTNFGIGRLIFPSHSLNSFFTHATSFHNVQGRYTRNVHEPEFLVPRHVHDDGKFHTYDLPKYYDRREINDRSKRSSDSEAGKLHLVLPFSGVDHHVELTPYHEFISPNMVIETRGPGIEKSLNEGLRFTRAPDQQCHYRGHIKGHSNSRAALSLCNGVTGYVQTKEGRYFIEPVDKAEPASDGQHVHMAYRREAAREKDETGSPAGESPKRRCGTSDNWEAAWAEQLAKRQQRLVEREEMQPVNSSIPIGPSKRASSKPSSDTHSIHRYVELGIVCDRRFLDYHKDTDYEKYVLTIMNMVADFYHDSSSGNQIDIVVVRITYLEAEKKEIDLSISPDADKTLASFAKWAEKMNPKDHKHPNHYDIAVLITRYDICSNPTSCNLMGLAYVAAACNPKQAAAINEDSGLLLGIVVAHEVGHVMGCAHDEKSDSGCPSQDKDKSYFLMSPIVYIYTIRWSTCSRKFITSLLESGLGECLNDNPRNPSDKFAYPNMLPGAMYDASAQCNFDKSGSSNCDSGPSTTCEQLWCKEGDHCITKGAPPAEGTKCGENKWCIRLKCVDMGSRPAAVHGGWGEWGRMSGCSRTCGAGVKSSGRECNKPIPSNGGRYCIGERRRISTCNITPCDPAKPPFRALQCAEFDKKNIGTDTVRHKWKPFMAPNIEPCGLYCVNEKNSYMKLATVVSDSTPCKGGTNNMCIGGICRKVGCDWVIDSDAVNDKCGICKGDGTQCSLVEGEFTATKLHDYQKVVTIPKGARSISVVEKAPCENTLAVKTEKDGKYCLNGNHSEERNGDYECGYALIIYFHPETQKEEVTIRGPLSEAIQIQYVFYNPNKNPGIIYKYYVKLNSSPSYKPKYLWDFTEWGKCTANCGGGTAVSNPSCIEEQNGLVSPSFCQGIPRPESKSRICNGKPCRAKWRVSGWSKCSACNGKAGLKHRKVQCTKPAARPGGDDVQADPSACRGKVPRQEIKCAGTRPCKKTCPKRNRDCEDRETEISDPKDRERSLMEQRRMIDNFVDLGLARYLEKTRRQTAGEILRGSLKRDVSDDFRSLLRDWVMLGNEEKDKRACDKSPSNKAILVSSGRFSGQNVASAKSQETQQQMNAGKTFTTPKPGSIIKDVVPDNEIVLYEAPLRDEMVSSNVSDIGFQEGGDVLGIGIDKTHQKVFHGAQAINILLGKGNQNESKVSQGEGASTELSTTVNVTEESKSPSGSQSAVKAATPRNNPKSRSFRIS